MMRMIGSASALCIGLASTALAATLQVGPGRTYTSLQQVVGLVNPGDVVEVDGNFTYPGGVTFTRAGEAAKPITIRGIRVSGNRPVLSGGTNTVAFTTPWPYTGPGADHYVFEGFDVTGGTARCIFHQANNLTIRDVVVHDCPAQGILGADEGSGSLLLEYTEVHHCGNGTSQHQIYMATDEVHYPGSVFRMQHCYVHDGNGGNNVKSRAERNEIYYNWIEGAFYHELELIGPDGGDGGNPALEREDSDVVGNVLFKRNTFYVVRVGGDGTGETNGRYRFVNNTFLCGSSAAFRIFDGIESIEMHNNVFHREGGAVTVTRTAEASWVAGEQIAGSRNWVLSGASAVPTQWTGTVYGTDPGFWDLAANDLRPAAGSPLLDEGTSAPSGPPGYPFPAPLFPPAKHPPMHQVQAPGTAAPRPSAGDIDIGAFELAGWSVVSIAVDEASHTPGSSDQNGVLEPGEQVRVAPLWHNDTTGVVALTGVASAFGGPGGAIYTLLDGIADYGTVAAGADGGCVANPYAIGLSTPTTRPAPHWDATFVETLSTGVVKTWTVHIGDSFADVPRSHWAYRFIETIFHNEVTAGCGGEPLRYCPGSTLTRAEMAVLLLMAKHGSGYVPPPATGLVFGDVPADHWAGGFIEALVAEGISSGCAPAMYCPGNPITRAEMAVFLLMAEHGSDYVPPASTGLVFGDVPIDHWAGDFIEQLAAEGIASGCAPSLYCPDGIVTRAEMAVFLSATFGLELNH